MNLKNLLLRIKDELKLRNYSRRTIESYLGCLADYFNFIKIVKKDPDIPLLKKYLLEKQARGQSPQTINLHLNAIKYFYREIYKSRVPINIKFAKTSQKLPVVLSRAEIDTLFSALPSCWVQARFRQ